ncbi:MAG: Xaa-Pro peptidase family protein [Spirochaetaceae bacterium]|nr:Xaa-Pro peptidase family protein [Spirochaetaceae bacterium]
MTTMQSVYRSRRERVAEFIKSKGIAAVRFEDFEEARSPSVRYLCGHPGDAFLVIGADASSVLVPWDENMANKMASVDKILPYTSFGRRSESAMRSVLEIMNVPKGARVEFPESMSYPSYIEHVAALDDWDLVCEKGGTDTEVLAMRSVKDEVELEIYERASGLTNSLIAQLEDLVTSGGLKTELDVALFIEKEARAHGAERTGFETIAAGPGRSFGIHAFPSYGNGPIGTKGLSILDFGIVIEGYTSDVTMSFARGPLSPEQATMVDLVQAAYELGASACKPGVPAKDIAQAIDNFFAKSGFSMPHALGHGIGLEAHEAPGVNLRQENKAVLVPGNIITLEPGLYHPEFGGVRLENDVLITETGCRVLTNSKIVML